jgi:hypothetical protein
MRAAQGRPECPIENSNSASAGRMQNGTSCVSDLPGGRGALASGISAAIMCHLPWPGAVRYL